MKKLIIFIFILFVAEYGFPQSHLLRMPKVFGSNMVLQRNMPVALWGTAGENAVIKIKLNKNVVSAKTDNSGKWKAFLPKMKEGGPYKLEIVAPDSKDTIVFDNVMIGEVWLCSGQSNMQMPLAGWGQIKNFEEEIAKADFPDIRLLTVEQGYAERPLEDMETTGWQECKPSTIKDFSATAYFFAREVYNRLKIPIGLLHSSSGGTRVEAWSSIELLDSLKHVGEQVNQMKSAGNGFLDSLARDYKKQNNAWNKYLDTADAGFKSKWYELSNWDSTWGKYTFPATFDTTELGNFDGSVWFIKKFFVKKDWLEMKGKLLLPSIDDYGKTFLNGKLLVEQKQKNYATDLAIPAGFLKEGENVIAVRILDLAGRGGIIGSENSMKIVFNDEFVPLSGEWFYKTAYNLKEMSPQPKDPRVKNYPSVLFNAMINPLIPFTIKGALWYQGESNQNYYDIYSKMFTNMIKDWRKKWGGKDFPFLFVQLANYMERKNEPVDENWARLREAQDKTLKLKNTGMANTIDIGDALDIHPKNKQDVGKRLALIGLKEVYNIKNIIAAGPKFESCRFTGGKALIKFTSCARGLKTTGEKISGFAVAGKDKKFYWADAKITGKTSIEISSDKVTEPVAVRYGWANNPEVNLFNSEDLPAYPFRTDDWTK